MSQIAPPPGSRSGVADYAAALARELGPLPRPVYHIGNNGLHREIYARALREPSVVVLHDAVLHHFFLGSMNREEYIAEFLYNYGEWRRDIAADLWESRAASGTDPRYFEFPMLRRIVETSRAVIVHNRGAERLAREHGGGRVHVIPHFHQPSGLDAADGVLFRERHRIDASTTLFGMFGYLRETKRVIPSIRAFGRLHALHPRTALLIAGQPTSSDLARVIAAEADRPGVIRLGHLSESEMDAAGAAIDCCINLRWPAAGETSGIAIRMMGHGKPVIMTESTEISDFPEGTRLTVGHGAAEVEELLAQMALVAEFPALGREIGAAAALHIRTRHSVETIANQYREIVER